MIRVRTASQRIRYFITKSSRDNIPAMAGQSAFFIILSSVPLIMLVISLYSIFFGVPEDFTLPSAAASITGDETYAYIVNFIYDSIRRSSSGTAVVTALLALWSAGRGMYIITNGILRIYRLPIKHLWLFRRVSAMGYTLAMLLMFGLSVGVMAANSFLSGVITDWTGSNTLVSALLHIFRYVLSVAIVTLLLTLSMKLFLLRRVKLRRHASFRALLPGMFIVTLAWNLLTLGVQIYNTHFIGSSVYGSLGSVMVLMMWVYFAMYILLCGVQFNYINRERFNPKKSSPAPAEEEKIDELPTSEQPSM